MSKKQPPDGKYEAERSETTHDLWRCPACSMPQTREYDECPQCGVLVKKFLERKHREGIREENDSNHSISGTTYQLSRHKVKLVWLFCSIAFVTVVALGSEWIQDDIRKRKTIEAQKRKADRLAKERKRKKELEQRQRRIQKASQEKQENQYIYVDESGKQHTVSEAVARKLLKAKQDERNRKYDDMTRQAEERNRLRQERMRREAEREKEEYNRLIEEQWRRQEEARLHEERRQREKEEMLHRCRNACFERYAGLNFQEQTRCVQQCYSMYGN